MAKINANKVEYANKCAFNLFEYEESKFMDL